jgi:hypothetical protein
MTFIGILAVIFGMFLVTSSILNWDYLLKKENLPSLFNNMPRDLARIAILVLGLVLLVCGIVFTFGLDK